MIPRQFPSMVAAEVRKVFTRGSAIAALAIALVVGVGVVVGFAWIQSWGEGGPSLNGTPMSELVKTTGVEVSGHALRARNFFVLPLFLLLAAASSAGGELSDRTLRELVVRPVPRWSILAAKLLALSALSAATLLVTLAPSLGLGAAVFGLQGEAPAPTVGALLGGYGASFLSDVGLLALGVAVSLVVPSVGGTLVAVVLLLMADLALRGVLSALAMFGVEEAKTVVPYLLGNALACWEDWQEGWDVAPFGALAAFVAGFVAFAVARFHRMDVP